MKTQVRKRILSFDPRNGVAVLGFDNDSVYVEDFFLIDPNRIDKELKGDIPAVGKEVVSLECVKKTLTDLLLDIKPDYVTVETPFHHQFVQAFRVLSIWVSTLAMTSYLVAKKKVYGFAPNEVRALIGTNSTDKTVCQGWLLQQLTVGSRSLVWEKDPGLLVSHTSDAVMVGMALVLSPHLNCPV